MWKSTFKQVCEILKQQKFTQTQTLDYKDPFMLIIALILAAQSKDSVVNAILRNFPCDKPEQILKLDPQKLYHLIKSVGYASRKTSLIIQASKYIVENGLYHKLHNLSYDELLKIPGIGSKSASFFRYKLHNEPYPVVDTHMYKFMRRFTGINFNNPQNIERWMKQNLEPETILCLNKLVVPFGREICTKYKPKCHKCPLSNLCNFTSKE